MTPTFLVAMAKDLLLSISEVMLLAKTAPHRYKVYTVAKRRGGKRTIAQPARMIKAMQRWIMKEMLDDLPLHENALGYRKGKNIADNASMHAANSYLLKLDFRDFFPSIVYKDIIVLVAACPSLAAKLPDERAQDLFARILLWGPKDGGPKRLSIGAPSSPVVSNLVMYNFDKVVSELARKRQVVYSRYADDLTFSGHSFDVLRIIHEEVATVVNAQQSPKVSLNQAKVFYGSKATRRTVTGLVLTNNNGISLGRDRKRLLRAKIHHALGGRANSEDRKSLQGWLAFANAVEPDFVARLRTVFGDDFAERISTGS